MAGCETISVPNQRYITTHKARARPREFTQINLTANLAALKKLSYKTYKLYMYLCYNADGYAFPLYKTPIKEALPRNSYYRAFDELVEQGYLVRDGTSNRYDFYEDPAQKDAVPDPVTTHTQPGDEASPGTAQKTNNKNTYIKKKRPRPLNASGKSAFDEDY